MKRGVFITLEGNEGCGKSTQLKWLAKHLRRKGRSVHTTREPGGTALGDAVRRLVLDPKYKRMSPVCETLLYMASRAQLVEQVILPRLKKGQIVLCDRWLDATLAYQGYAGGVDVDWIRRIGETATHGLKPDLTLYLDLPVRVGLKRAARTRPADRIERKALGYHEDVRRGFLQIARSEPRRFRRLAVRPDETIRHVHERIRAEVDRVVRRH